VVSLEKKPAPDKRIEKKPQQSENGKNLTKKRHPPETKKKGRQ